MKPEFSLHIITPSHIKKVDKVSFFRAEDSSGSFGIFSRHIEFLTILEPSIAIALIEGVEEYFAFNGGILSFKKEILMVTTKEFVQSKQIDELEEAIKRFAKERKEKESIFHFNMENLQKAFFKKMIELERGLE